MEENNHNKDFYPDNTQPDMAQNGGDAYFDDKQVGDVELDLDPELTPYDDANTTKGEIGDGFSTVNNRIPVEPMPPLMPHINEKRYEPAAPLGASQGIKVFAVIIALMVVMSACVTGGYFLGKIKRNEPTTSGTSAPAVDLASKPTPENAKTVSQVYNEINPSVVGIHVYNESAVYGTASGVIYSKDGYIITNDHIYAGIPSAKFMVYAFDGKKYNASFVAGDSRSDIAVLKIEEEVELQPAVFGNSKEIVTGETVVAIGRPNGANKESVASEGVISVPATRVTTTTTYSSKLIQTDTAINPGSSGGALCNIYGQVIGITSAKLVGNEYDGVGYAIPTASAIKIVDDLIKHGQVKNRAKLGISYKAIDELDAKINGGPCGLEIAEISEESDLYGKRINIGDIITHINDVEIKDADYILDVIEQAKPGETIQLKVYSVTDDMVLDISVKLLEDKGTSSYEAEAEDDFDLNN